MKHIKSILASAALVALPATIIPAASASETFGATSTITTPSYQTPAYYSGAQGATVPAALASTNQDVSVDGGTPNSYINVSYTLNITFANGFVVTDDSNSGLQLLNSNGHWDHKANGTGNMSGTAMPTEGPDYETPYTADAISEIIDNTAPKDRTPAHYANSGGVQGAEGTVWICLKQ